MRTNFLLAVISLMVLLFEAVLIDGRFSCYRRLKKKNKCGGFLRNDKYIDVQSCCSGKGQGYADKKIKIGRNRFRCIPCSDSQSRAPPSVTRVAEAISSTSWPTTTTMTTIITEFFWPSPPKRDFAVPLEHTFKNDTSRQIVWEEWSPCSVSCGAGWRSRAKECNSCDRNDYENVQSQPCMINFYCPVDGNWGPWYPWEACTSTCNGGTRTRQRKCNYPPPAYGGENCEGDAVAAQDCNKKQCPVDGNWSEWSEFSDCSSTCGPGVSRKTRRCDSPLPQFGGKNCPGSESFIKKCEVVRCPVDGGWSLWATWTLCTATCGKGVRKRSRVCDSPRPQFGGLECEGSTTHQEECYGGQLCPVDGNWSPWTSYGFCRAPRCGRGHQMRSRTCSSPPPGHGGKPCVGQQYERVACFNEHDCPKNGSWCEWSEWNACSSSCSEESSLQGRQRTCDCPAPSNGGQECQGDSFQVQECKNLAVCNIPGQSQLYEDGISIDEETYPDENIDISTEKLTLGQVNNSSNNNDEQIKNTQTDGYTVSGKL
uniref:Uncharacterized protein n=1 Tax=Arion vulgaris TaxID=1028688 RepID=A0A0B7A791_9EUPU